MLTFRQFLSESRIRLAECIGLTMNAGGKVIVAKNRDRAYKPDLEIIHTLIDGTEVAYLHDVTTDWSEGMNEAGIGIVNTALFVGYDEDEKKILKSGGKPSKDGARIRYALSKKSIEEVVKAVSSYKGGVKGHTIIASPDAVYTVELTSQHKAHIIRHEPGTFLVRTNHGDEYLDAGYTQADDPEDYKSSVARREGAINLLHNVTKPEEVLPALRTQLYDKHSNLNVVRDTNKMNTSSQLLLNLTDLTLELDYFPEQTDKMLGVQEDLPDDYIPKLTITTRKVEPITKRLKA